MIEEFAADFLPIWMLMSAAFGFLIGDVFGDSRRHRKCLQQANDDLRNELEKADAAEELLRLALKQQRGVLNDIQANNGCDKSPPKTAFLSPTKSMAGSHRSGRVKTYRF